jgi:hypothetical protein
MAFNTISGNVPGGGPGQTDDLGVYKYSAQSPLTAASLIASFRDALQALRYQTLPGVLAGGVCTVAGLVVTVPTNTIYAAGSAIWTNSGAETKTVTDDVVNYIWGRSDGLLDITTTTTPPPVFEGGNACIIVKATAVTGVVTLDHSVQHRARTADHTNRFVKEGEIRGNGTGQKRGRAAVAYASDANKTLSQAEYECHKIDVGSGFTLTVTRDLVFPLTDGADWLVNNNSTGGQSIQCIGPTGTGVTIATGKAALIWSDGVNVKRGSADVTP